MNAILPNQSVGNHIVFIDTSIPNYQVLSENVLAGTIVVFLEAHQAGITEITETLAEYDNLNSIQIMSHGQAGRIYLGNDTLDLDRLRQPEIQSQLSHWSEALRVGGDLLLYGCNVGEGVVGTTFLQQLQAITQLDVAASTNLTGSSVIGADWDLELSTGAIESSIAIEAHSLNEFEGTLGDLTLSRTLFLGGSSADEAIGVEINSENLIVAVGNINGVGTLFRLNTIAGSSPISQLNLGGTAKDMDIIRGTNATQRDRIVVVGSFGIKVYEKNGTTIVWSQSGNFDRVAVANDGRVVTLGADNTVQLWSNTGTSLGTAISVDGSPDDLAINRDGTQVYVTGYRQATSILQIPYLRAYSISGNQISGTEAWDSWDFATTDVQSASLNADSRGVAITIGEDGNLYFLGYTDGGNNVFQRNPNNINTNASLINVDNHNSFSGAGAGSFTFYAQINPTDGSLVKAQNIVTRLSSGGANSFSPGAITADAAGNVYVGGTASANLYERNTQTINGQTVGAYSGGDLAVFAATSALTSRNYWTPLVRSTTGTSGANGTVVDFATGNGFQVVLATATQANELFTIANDSSITPLGGNDIYLAVIGTPPATPTTLTIAATNATQTEGNSGTKAFTFTVTRSGNLSGTHAVNYAITGSGTNAANATDFGGTLPTGTVNFAANETSKVITINVSGDTTIEPDEGFTVTLSNPTNGATLTTATVTGMIQNDDVAPSTLVTTTNDSGSGSLRAAIAAATAGSTITFASSLANQTIILSSELNLTQNITIDGSGAAGLTVSGGNAVRIFNLTGSITVNINDLILANGRATAGTGEERSGAAIRGSSNSVLNIEDTIFRNNVAGFGGAIYAGFSSINTVTNSIFENNDGSIDGSERGGGAIATKSNSRLTVTGSTFSNNKGTNGGAINSLLGGLTIENSTFLNNTTQGTGTNTNGYGGAVYTDGANASGVNYTPGNVGGTIAIRDSHFEGNIGRGQGGGLFLYLYSPDQLILEDSVIINNRVIRASNGDGLGGGVRLGNGSYTIKNTTFANNIAEAQGGGLWVGEVATGSISNSTFWGNRAINPTNTQDGLGGGLLFATTSPQQLINVTIASNQAGGEGGGIVGRNNVTLTNTIVANNTGNNPFGNKQNASDGLGFNATPSPYFTDGGNNIQWPAITNNFNDANITATVIQLDPKLGTLQEAANGQFVVPLLSGSAAIDAGKNSGAPTTDQRGQSRPVDGDNNGSAIVDIGAYELTGGTVQPTTLTIAGTNATQTEGNSGTKAFTFTVTRSGNLSGTHAVNYAITGSGNNAANGADFGGTLPSGTVTFAASETSKVVTVNVSGDTTIEPDEGFTVTLSNPTNNATLTTATATGTIQNDDVAPTTTQFTIAATNANQTEGNSGTKAFTFTVTRSGNLSGTHTVNYAISGTGSNPANTADFGGVFPVGMLTFGTNTTTRTITIYVGGDTIFEADEGFKVTLSNPSNGAVLGTATATGTILNDELIGNNANNILNGTTGHDLIFGMGGNDTLNGGNGNDRLDGGTGTDRLVGGSGNDTYVIDTANDIILEEANGGIDTIESSVTLSLANLPNVEHLTLIGTSNLNGTGNIQNNVIRGNSGNNILNGGAGIDTLIGGLGNDIYVVDSITDTITELNNQGTDTIESSVTFSLANLVQIENLTLTGTANINGTGNTLNNIIRGNSGNNVLNGGTGIDTLIGGLGNDTYGVDTVTDIITELSNQGIDTIESSVTFSLANLVQIENLTLTGTSNLQGTGNTQNNVIRGNSGNNILNGGAGIDTLVGGLGNDIYLVDSITDTITESNNQGIDTIESSVTFSLANIAYIENLTLTGKAHVNGTGNSLNNLIQGNSGRNLLNGGAGIDQLTGGAGNDQFIFQFGQSITSKIDRITDFAIGSDKIDLLTQGGLAMAAPTSLSRSTNSSAASLSSAVSQVFADANGALSGAQPLGLNSAALVVISTASIEGTYLIVNDGVAGFQSNNDLVVNLTGYTGTLPNLGTIPVANFFI